MKVNFSMYFGILQIIKKVDVMDVYELVNFIKDFCDMVYQFVGGNLDDLMEMCINFNYKYLLYMVFYIEGK